MDKFLVNSFDGGITDHYLSATPNYAAKADNLLIDEDGKLYSRWGWKLFGTKLQSATLTNVRISGLYIGSNPFGRPVSFLGSQAYYLNESDTFTEIVGPASNVAAPNKTNTSLEACVMWQKQLIYCSPPSTVLPHRIYCTSFAVPVTFKALTLGLPALASSPTLASAGGTGSSYIYTFHYLYDFTDADGTTYEEKGPITSVSISNVGAPNANNITISAVPVLANTASTNYDVTTSLKIKIYRTINNGSTSYLLTTLSNGTTSYVDSTSDATISSVNVIYTDGGVLDYNPPIAGTYYVTQVNNTFWYATERILYHSIQGAPGACPDEFQQQIDQKVIGLNNTISFPVLFCDQSVYRVDGLFDEFGDGGYELREISKIAGCVSNRSIVKIPDGIVWAGNGGFYFSDGYKVLRISKHLDYSYKTWNNANITGAYDPANNIVYWTVNSTSNSSVNPNDVVLALHLNKGISETCAFTTLSAVNNLYPICLAYTSALDADSRFRSKVLMGESRGYLLYMDELTYTDPNIDVSLAPSAMTKKAIIFRYESIGLDLGDDSTRKYCTNLTSEMNNFTDLAVQYYSRRDDGGPWQSLSEIREDGSILWGYSEYGWNDPLDTVRHDWNSQRIIEGMRHFPAGTLRSVRRQVAITNALTYVTKSDDKGLATTDTTNKTVTLNTVTSFWPGDCEDYEIAFDSDLYVNYYKVKTRNSDLVVTVYDPYSTLPAGATLKWQMRAQRKFERIEFLSYAIWFDTEGTTQAPSRGTAGYVNT